jgi:hypothetical protein
MEAILFVEVILPMAEQPVAVVRAVAGQLLSSLICILIYGTY